MKLTFFGGTGRRRSGPGHSGARRKATRVTAPGNLPRAAELRVVVGPLDGRRGMRT
jgi:hypothetical protein